MKPDIPKKAPGQKLVQRMPLRTKWILCAIAGLLLFSFGLSVLGTASTLKSNPTVPFFRWFIWGLYGMIITNLGLVSFGQAIRFKILMDINKRFSRHEKEISKQSKKVNHLGEILRGKEDKKNKGKE
jgi:membrane protein DedA with SNARE-associated domain